MAIPPLAGAPGAAGSGQKLTVPPGGRFELGHNRKRGRPGREEEVWIECRCGPWVRLVQGLQCQCHVAHAPPFLARQTDGRFSGNQLAKADGFCTVKMVDFVLNNV